MAEVKVITSSNIHSCPKRSILPAHYRPDGSCRCDERHDLAQLLTALLAQQRELGSRVSAAREQLHSA